MRIVRHPNIVELKAFYYSTGERVCRVVPFACISHGNSFLTTCSTTIAERRSVSEPGARVCARDRVPGITVFQQDEDHHADDRGQALHLPALPIPSIHTFSGHLPSRHQAPEPSA